MARHSAEHRDRPELVEEEETPVSSERWGDGGVEFISTLLPSFHDVSHPEESLKIQLISEVGLRAQSK